jgi:hypothetical protein
MQSVASRDIEKVVEFTVPLLVPSGNHYKEPCRYTGKDGYPHLGYKITKEAKAFYDAVALFARQRTVAPEAPAARRKVRYSVRIDVYLGPRDRGDFDNFWKCGLDGLVKAGVIHSDNYVDGDRSNSVVHKDERDNPYNPRTHYRVERLED